MKRYLLALFALMAIMFSATEVKASHLAGGEIYYKHVTGNKYRVFVYIYRDVYGISMPTTVTLCVSSSCASSTNYTLGQIPDPVTNAPSGSQVQDLNECAKPIPGQTGGGVDYQKYIYGGLVIDLGTQCADWRFSLTQNARNSAVDNLVSPGSQNLYLEAKLNNTIGPNTSPEFITPAIKRWCIVDPTDPASKPVVWSQAAVEPDGDSVYYKFANPQGGPNCGPGTTINWSTGYSLLNPMTTYNGIQVDAKTGTFTFMPIQEEIVVVRIDVEEYRWDNILLRWQFVGNSMRDMQIAISSVCENSVATGDRLDFGAGTGVNSSIPIDSLRAMGAIAIANRIDSALTTANDTFVKVQVLQNYNCNDATVTLPFASPLLCSSIVPTDFRIMGPDGIGRPVTQIIDNCGPDLTTKEITLKLHQSFDVNGVYLLYIRRGNDGNTLTNRCGFEIRDNVMYLINVQDCPELDYEIDRVTVLEDKKIKVEFNLDPLSYFSNTFNSIRVMRSKNDQQFEFITEITNQLTREYIDSSVDAWAVDHQAYQYILQMYTNGNPRKPTNFVNSMVLVGDSVSDTQMELTWNSYDNTTFGSLAEYEVFEGTYDSTASDWVWTSLKKVGTNLSYIYTMPDPEQRPGQFWLKVEASDPSGTNTKISESNWITLGVPEPPIPPVQDPVVNYVPNVITPNGDMQNDRFYFQFQPVDPSKRPYSNMSLSIFNRWGKQVFHDDDFMARNTQEEGWDGTDQGSNARVADGVYFYVAKFSDQQTGKSEELKGSVTVLGVGTN